MYGYFFCQTAAGQFSLIPRERDWMLMLGNGVMGRYPDAQAAVDALWGGCLSSDGEVLDAGALGVPPRAQEWLFHILSR
ncbi:hypothetical protein BKK79_25815 [Cupriavidus sp. USMAA2-4]|uniref:Uncharacterized protein n=1 Tax=Cupriavidus malaysiensis TaxID=367825 RepID=A0ABM6F9P1_9BURK|nr:MULTISPECIES: hypothetical protein [Cupriavidus]AOY95210.1 hypothetical protein BKK79_25815 [Cupriavidus sp. USMAA2-4]AOZ01890.1 hypothetical protein BKK81_21280 [Cupriavidus sp. USMAHM13]AOZ08373.1 hypothetical protein BKK80_20600 [Cupriavidus malaysiensis]